MPPNWRTGWPVWDLFVRVKCHGSWVHKCASYCKTQARQVTCLVASIDINKRCDIKKISFCLICQTTIAIPVQGNVERYFRTVHKKYNTNLPLKSELTMRKVRELKSHLQSFFTQQNSQAKATTSASLRMSLSWCCCDNGVVYSSVSYVSPVCLLPPSLFSLTCFFPVCVAGGVPLIYSSPTDHISPVSLQLWRHVIL